MNKAVTMISACVLAIIGLIAVIYIIGNVL